MDAAVACEGLVGEFEELRVEVCNFLGVRVVCVAQFCEIL